MRKYTKPCIKCVELRIEEGLAGIGSISVLMREDKSVVHVISSDDNSYNFWLKILRKRF